VVLKKNPSRLHNRGDYVSSQMFIRTSRKDLSSIARRKENA
jgi:hypothetical protein